MTFKSIFTLGLVAASGLSQMSCSESKSQQVGVSFIPNRPVVMIADIKILDISTPDATDTIDINAPWFRSYMTAKNNSDTTVTIAGFKAEVTAADGQVKEYESTLPTDAYYITELDPGEEFNDPTFGTYFHTLPEPENTKNFRYRVSVTVIGWFGTATAPQERFQRTITFTTN